MPIETLFLDAGGVLVEPSWRRVSEILGRHGIEADAEALRRAEPRARHQLDVPHVINSTRDASRASIYFELTLEHAGYTVPEDVLARACADLIASHGESNLWEVIPPGVLEALARLQARVPLVVVSNANGTVQALFDRLDISRFFTAIIDSAVVGVEKPDPAIFRLALDRCGGRPEATLHVGDLFHVDVAGARAAGLHACLLDPAGLYPQADCLRIESLTELADGW